MADYGQGVLPAGISVSGQSNGASTLPGSKAAIWYRKALELNPGLQLAGISGGR